MAFFSDSCTVCSYGRTVLGQPGSRWAMLSQELLWSFHKRGCGRHCQGCQRSYKVSTQKTKDFFTLPCNETFPFYNRVMEAILANSPASTELPSVQQLVAAYNVGSMTKNAQLCRWLFPCSSANKAVTEVTSRKVSEEDVEAEARFVTCKHISRLCPGVSLSCGLCAVFGYVLGIFMFQKLSWPDFRNLAFQF